MNGMGVRAGAIMRVRMFSVNMIITRRLFLLVIFMVLFVFMLMLIVVVLMMFMIMFVMVMIMTVTGVRLFDPLFETVA